MANRWNGPARSGGEHAWWDDADVLLAELDEALRTERDVPASFVAAGKMTFAWHNVDAELATLTYDSATDRAPVGAVTRSEAAPLRALTFTSPRLSVHIEVVKDALHGQVVPAQAGEMELRPVNGPSRTVHVDEVGWFVVRPLPTCSFRLRCRTADGAAVITDWILL